MQDAVDRLLETADTRRSWAEVQAAAANVAAVWEAVGYELYVRMTGIQLARNQLDVTLEGLANLVPWTQATVPAPQST